MEAIWKYKIRLAASTIVVISGEAIKVGSRCRQRAIIGSVQPMVFDIITVPITLNATTR